MCLGFTFFDIFLKRTECQETADQTVAGCRQPCEDTMCLILVRPKPFSTHILVRPAVWWEVLRHISQGSGYALLHIMQQSWSVQPAVPAYDTKPEDVPPLLMGGQSVGPADAAGWMLGLHTSGSALPVLSDRAVLLASVTRAPVPPHTGQRVRSSVHHGGWQQKDRNPLCSAFLSAATALLGGAGTAVSDFDRYRLMFAFTLFLLWL